MKWKPISTLLSRKFYSGLFTGMGVLGTGDSTVKLKLYCSLYDMKNNLLLILPVLLLACCNSKNERSEAENNRETENIFNHLTMEDSDFHKRFPEGEVELY